MTSTNETSLQQPTEYCGIHLSGPNTHKTAIVTLTQVASNFTFKVTKIYDKLGSIGSVFSDDRILRLLSHIPYAKNIFVDCPMSNPPCVDCEKEICPGINLCEVVATAFMQQLATQIKQRDGKRRRPFNPQSHRIFDLYDHLTHKPEKAPFNPSYNNNLSPLVTRAKCLQRRLRALTPAPELQETNVTRVLEELETVLDIPRDSFKSYRDFDVGRGVRRKILMQFAKRKWVIFPSDPREGLLKVADDLEIFHAFICAWINASHEAKKVHKKPEIFSEIDEWVYLPDIGSISSTLNET